VTGDALPFIAIEDLVKDYRASSGLFAKAETLRAVDHVSLSIERGESLGLVGESGSGKTTLGRCILRLVKPTSGKVMFDRIDVLSLEAKALRALRRRMQIVFQDPYGSLNPRMTVGAAVREPIVVHGIATKKNAEERVAGLFDEVGMDPSYMERYPHELSGGQRQRVGIARALSLEPEFIVLDEPVSALDVSVQAQVLNLLADLRNGRGLTYLFIAHDLAVVRHVADRVAVMYLGRLLEVAPAADVYSAPLHPYSTSLLSAIPKPDPEAQTERIVLSGDMPSARSRPPGCAFYPRCPHPGKDDVCQSDEPPLEEVSPGRIVACFRADEPMRTDT
jgi:peptide/nickel transport system ATP-binding protein/oligopeptide transport system ATP-binding protein